jgi:hypothetical protein
MHGTLVLDGEWIFNGLVGRIIFGQRNFRKFLRMEKIWFVPSIYTHLKWIKCLNVKNKAKQQLGNICFALFFLFRIYYSA